MTKEEVTLRDYFEIKFQNIDDKLTGISSLGKTHYEDSCKKLNDLENSFDKLEKQTRFARFIQKNAIKSLALLISLITIVVILLYNFGIIQFIKLI